MSIARVKLKFRRGFTLLEILLAMSIMAMIAMASYRFVSANITAVTAVFKSLKDSGELNTLTKKDLTVDPSTLKVIPIIKVPAP